MLRRQNAEYVGELVGCVEELATVRRHLEASAADGARLRGDLQAAVDARNLLYREHTAETTRLAADAAHDKAAAVAAQGRAAEAEGEVSALRAKIAQLELGEDAKQAALESVMLKMRLEKVRSCIRWSQHPHRRSRGLKVRGRCAC